MSEPMQINEAVRVLNEHRYRDASDWRIETRPDCRWDVIAGPGNPNCSFILESEDAIAIAQGLLDAETLREVETQLALLREQVEFPTRLNAALRQSVERAEAEQYRLAAFIESEGYTRCDIGACNCNSFHGGHASIRLSEIRDALGERTQGQTLLTAVEKLVIVDEQYEVRAADYATLRTAALPFVEVVRTLSDMPGILGYVDMQDWRNLAAAFGEDEKVEAGE